MSGHFIAANNFPTVLQEARSSHPRLLAIVTEFNREKQSPSGGNGMQRFVPPTIPWIGSHYPLHQVGPLLSRPGTSISSWV